MQSTGATHPFARLDPGTVLDAIDATGMRTDGRLLALASYENRVYQAGLEDGHFIVAKFYRPDRWSDEAILEEHAFSLQLAEHEIPAVPPMRVPGGATLTLAQGFRVAIFERRGGRTPELDDPEVLAWLGRYIGRIHAVGAMEGYSQRPVLDARTYGELPGESVLACQHLPADLREAYQSSLGAALEAVRTCFERAGAVKQLRLHGDCHPGNVLWTDNGPHFVDFDDSCLGPAVQDLWMLVSGTRAEMNRQLCDLLAGYEDFAEFNPREVSLIEALRTLRMIHHAAWLARRWDDPAFPVAFPWFNTRGWWEEHIGNLRDQLPRMAEDWLF